MQKGKEIDRDFAQTLYIIALYMTADERTKRAVDFILSLNQQQLETIREIAHAKNKCKPSENQISAVQ